MSAYADDIVLGIIGKKTIVRILKVLKQWAKDYDMKFNQEKTKIIFPQKRKKRNKNIQKHGGREEHKNVRNIYRQKSE